MILGVAIKNENILITLPKPNRHCDCFQHAYDLGIKSGEVGLGVKAINQGFYTHTGRYLNREQAAKYVKRIKQPVVSPVGRHLFSEEVW